MRLGRLFSCVTKLFYLSEFLKYIVNNLSVCLIGFFIAKSIKKH